jgi:decaprenylphospho-beta-D-ribofuranose 2-oxidase
MLDFFDISVYKRYISNMLEIPRTTKQTNKDRNFFNPRVYVPAILILVFLIKFTVWDNPNQRWIIQDIYSKPGSDFKGTIASPISLVQKDTRTYTFINDASKLKSAQASDYQKVSSKDEITQAVKKATTEKKKISMSGARHSMGGQNLGEQIHLDMLGYDKVVEYSDVDQSVTVESGITWKQLQEYLGEKNRAVRVMQDSNIFTVGGSMGTNVHGKDVRYGQLIESINWFKLVQANGQEIRVDRQLNRELFGSVIGGFGGFGVITEVNLKTDPNTNYKYSITYQNAEQVVAKWDEYSGKGAEQIEAHFSISQDSFLKEAQIYYYEPTSVESKDDVSGENSIWLRKFVYRVSRLGDLGKRFRWWMQSNVGPRLDPGLTTRNTAMAAPFRTLELDDPQTTDILQEYFVPRTKVEEFLPRYRELLKSNNMNLINCVLRRVQSDTEALVNYSEQEMYGFVCYYKVNRDPAQNANLHGFTGDIIDYLSQIDGKFYLAYGMEGYSDKILKMYPKLTELITLKSKYDPENMFDNKFFQQLRKQF